MTTYLLSTSARDGDKLVALSVLELAELIECALAAGDQVDSIRVHSSTASPRGLTPAEMHQLMSHLDQLQR